MACMLIAAIAAVPPPAVRAASADQYQWRAGERFDLAGAEG